MTAKQRIQKPSSMHGKVRIPNHDRYFIDEFGNVFLYIQTFGNNFAIHKLKVYRDVVYRKDYVVLVGKGNYWKTTNNKYFIEDLLQLAFPNNTRPKIRTIIKYESGAGRKPLNRPRVINHLLRFHPDVQISLTPNKEGIYETSEGMKQLAIRCCENCGNFTTDHAEKCSECNEWLLKS